MVLVMTRIPPKIEELVKSFARHKVEYKKSAYNETEVRIEFVNPFWTALGWDVENKSGYAMPYRDVIHEDAVKIGGTTKAPDYGFRIGGTRKFFVETKKPSLNLKDDPSPANQLRRYAWNCKLSLSILMDFEEFAVYDCRVRPKPSDKASTARIMYITYEEYVDYWEEIESIFSRESILRGSFDKYAESRKRKAQQKLTMSFGRFGNLARIACKKLSVTQQKLTVRELNYVVQMTIDRIIFLGCAKIEDWKLPTTSKPNSGKNLYAQLFDVFRYADLKYNSGLFHFAAEEGRTSQVDILTANLAIDDKVLKDILLRCITHNRHMNSAYYLQRFWAVPTSDSRKVITLTKSHRAKCSISLKFVRQVVFIIHPRILWTT